LLLALAGDDLHGYAILKEVELRTSGKVKAEHGNALWNYQTAACRRLIVERRSRPAEADDDERRRYYRMTEKGGK